MFIVNRNDIDNIKDVDIEYENPYRVFAFNGDSYTKFGPVEFAFETMESAVKHVTLLLDDEIDNLVNKLSKIKDKKTKFDKKVK